MTHGKTGNNGSSLPGLWVFLLIVLGILLVIISGTSFVMRIIQRRHRQNLRRRIVNGEVDLEALGIKRLNVPQDVLDKMPIHTYFAHDPSKPLPNQPPAISESLVTSSTIESAPSDPKPANEGHGEISSAKGHLKAQGEHRDNTSESVVSNSIVSDVPCTRFSQYSCAICLDDFEPNVTQVRELPCGHIFHPECVDPFLRNNSSLCPMCKKSVLPIGYCPGNVTNAMVRRERLVRRMRERVTLEVTQVPTNDGVWGLPGQSVSAATGSGRASFHRQYGRTGGRRISSVPNATTSTVDMASRQDAPDTGPSPIQAPSHADIALRRAWGRNRLIASLGNRTMAEDEENAREATMPKCGPPVFLHHH